MKTKILFLTGVLAMSSLLAACGPSTIYTQPQPPMRTITVTGTGMVTLTPDIAYVYIGVRTQNASASQALNQNNVQTQAVIDAIKALGVAEADIKTTNFNVSPQPIYDDNYNQIGTTYAVDNTVYVTVRDLEKLGTLLDSSVQSGANTVFGITFDLADKADALTQARLAAVQEARKQADELAEATSVEIGDVQSISYYDSTPNPVFYEARAAMDAASSVPVQSGSMQVTTTVTIVYEIE